VSSSLSIGTHIPMLYYNVIPR